MSLQRRKDGKIHTSWHEYKVFNVSSYLFIDPRRRKTTTEFLTFSSGAGIPNDKWFLRLSFDHSLYSETWVAVQFNSVSKKIATRGYYSIYVVDRKKNEIFVGRRPEYFKGHHIQEIIHFLKRNSASEREQFLPKDTLTVRLQLTLFLDDITPLPADEIIELYPKADLPDNFKELYKSKDTDGDIEVQIQRQRFRVHKHVLNIRCPKLLDVLISSQAKKIKNSIILDIDPKIFEKVIEFIYLDRVTDLDDYIEALFGEADKYDLKSLKRICEKSLSEDFLTVENAQTIYDLAVRFNSHELSGYVVMFLKFNVREIKDRKALDDRGESLIKMGSITS